MRVRYGSTRPVQTRLRRKPGKTLGRTLVGKPERRDWTTAWARQAPDKNRAPAEARTGSTRQDQTRPDGSRGSQRAGTGSRRGPDTHPTRDKSQQEYRISTLRYELETGPGDKTRGDSSGSRKRQWNRMGPRRGPGQFPARGQFQYERGTGPQTDSGKNRDRQRDGHETRWVHGEDQTSHRHESRPGTTGLHRDQGP